MHRSCVRLRRPLGRSQVAVLAVMVAAASTIASLCGCSLTPPQPWEKELLARPVMAIDDDPLDSRNRQHVYMSREGASGGQAVGGGGCGCN